jgi:hypothetical protein
LKALRWFGGIRIEVGVRNRQYDLIRLEFHRSVGNLGEGFDVYVRTPIKLQNNCTRTLSVDQQFSSGERWAESAPASLPSAALIAAK